MSLLATALDSAHATGHEPIDGVIVLAQETEVTTGGLRTWIKDNVVFTILVLAACVIGVGGMRGNLSKVVTVGALSIVGLAFLAVSTNENAAMGVGNWVLSLFGIQA